MAKLTLELSTSKLIVSAGYQQDLAEFRQKYGEGSRLEIEVLREGLPITPTELEEFVWCIKPEGLFGSAHILGGCETFTWDSDLGRFVGLVDYNVDELKELLSWDEDQVNARVIDLMRNAFERFHSFATESRLPYRLAATVLGVKTIADSHRMRGLHP